MVSIDCPVDRCEVVFRKVLMTARSTNQRWFSLKLAPICGDRPQALPQRLKSGHIVCADYQI